MASPALAGNISRLGVAALLVASVGVSLLLLSTSFRLPLSALDAAWQANLGRVLAAATAGLAFGGAAALRPAGSRPLREPLLFAVSVGGALGFVLGLKWLGGLPWAGLAAVAAAGLAAGGVRAVDWRRRASNLGLAAVLGLLLVAGALAYLLAATEVPDGRGVVALWLLGDVSHASAWGGGAMLALAVGLLAMALRETRSGRAGNARSLLFGLGLGAAGPLAFVGWFAPWCVDRLALRPGRSEGGLSDPARAIGCAALAGALVIAADAVPRLLIGGYAPPLNVSIGIVAVPSFLLWNRARLRALPNGRAGWLLTVLEGAGIAAAVLALALSTWAVVGFARLAA